jgi:hypothetical protein
MTALARCFATTFRAIVGCSKFEHPDLAVEAKGTVGKNGLWRLLQRDCHPSPPDIPDEEQREWAIRLLDEAKALGLVLRAPATTRKFEARVISASIHTSARIAGYMSTDILGRGVL